MGTRFCATVEAPIHPRAKQLLVDNDERGTNVIFRSLRNTARVGKNSVSDSVVEILKRPDARFEDVAHLVRGAQAASCSKLAIWTLGSFGQGRCRV